MNKKKISSQQSTASSTTNNPLSFLRNKNTLWIALFIITALLRLTHLPADPPIGLTTSQGVYTDPAAYTMYAKNATQTESYNPLGDYRFPLFQYSAVTPVSRAIFAIAGIGSTQANFSALLFSLSTILLICLLLRKHHGPAAVFFMLAFLALNKNQFFYGRLPFLENPMVFFGVLSIWIADSFQKKTIMQALAGIAMSASFLLGKSHGLVFVGVFAGFFLWRLFLQEAQVRSKEWNRIAIFTSGTLLGCAIWFAIIGWPNLDAISYYLTEQSTGLYGPPEAFESFTNFFWKLFSLGILTFGLPVSSLIAFTMLSIALYKGLVCKGESGLQSLSTPVVIMILWLVLVWLELFAWNYRPLRYQIPMAYPICALSGIALGKLWDSWKSRIAPAPKESSNANPLSKRLLSFYSIFGFILIFPVYQLWSRISLFKTGDFSFNDSIWKVVATTVIIWIVYIGFDQLWRRNPFRLPIIFTAAAILILPTVSFSSGLAWYTDWEQRPTFTIESVSKDLPKMLSPNAVLSGPYGVGLCQNNNLSALVHQFGISDPDTTFLDNFPVTHLLLDESNMKRFQQMYPAVANRTFALHTYHITNIKVSLIRIAGATKNKTASAYKLSAFETGKLAMEGRLKDPSSKAVAGLMNIDTSNIAVNLYMARRAESSGALKEAKFFLECAAGAVPTDYNTQAELGRINLALYNKTGTDMFRQSALDRFTIANHLNPGAERIAEKLAEVKKLK